VIDHRPKCKYCGKRRTGFDYLCDENFVGVGVAAYDQTKCPDFRSILKGSRNG
jgi:hypothetical protein